MEKKSLSS